MSCNPFSLEPQNFLDEQYYLKYGSNPLYRSSDHQMSNQSFMFVLIIIFSLGSLLSLVRGIGEIGGHQGWRPGGHFTDLSQTGCFYLLGGGVLGITLAVLLSVKTYKDCNKDKETVTS